MGSGRLRFDRAVSLLEQWQQMHLGEVLFSSVEPHHTAPYWFFMTHAASSCILLMSALPEILIQAAADGNDGNDISGAGVFSWPIDTSQHDVYLYVWVPAGLCPSGC